MNQIMNLDAFVSLSGDKLVTDSRKVAEAFGKQHQHVTQKLESLDCSAEFLTSNFSLVTYKHKGNTYKAYEMTKDGFMFLVMGFTGKQASAIKEGYITAFNAMADQLRNRDLNLWQQMHQLIALEVESKVRASFGSHLMLKRKKEKPLFEAKRTELGNVIQPSLLLN